MNIIKTLSDFDFNITPLPFDNPRIRYGARGIVFNDKNEIAILNKTKKNEFKLIGSGGFIKKSDLEAYNKMWDEIRKENKDLIEQDKTGEDYIKDMFVYELENHEYGYTHELEDTLDALELTYEQVMESPSLKHGLELAKKGILDNEKEKNYEYE